MIEFDEVFVQAGPTRLGPISFVVPTGEYAALMGRTGAGKTTALEALCGLRKIASGTIRLAGESVHGVPPADRGIGYVPQDGALFPQFTVREHLAFALRVRRRPRPEIDARVAELAEELGLTALLDRLPEKLSGGERQRTALGRALAFRPAYLVLDEPLSALDDESHASTLAALLRIRDRRDATVLHVTHRRAEAERLADRLFEMTPPGVTESVRGT